MDTRIGSLTIDNNGRFCPPNGLRAAVTEVDERFNYVTPSIDFERLHARIRYLAPLNACIPSSRELRQQAATLQTKIMRTPYAGLMRGCCLPIYIPQWQGNFGQIVTAFVQATANSYEVECGKMFFSFCTKFDLSNEVVPFPGTNQEYLLTAMSEGPVAGSLFLPFMGWSTEAIREVMPLVPPSCVVGGIDLLAALALYPETLARDYLTPGLELAGIMMGSDKTIGFWPCGTELEFFRASGLCEARGYYTSSLLYLG